MEEKGRKGETISATSQLNETNKFSKDSTVSPSPFLPFSLSASLTPIIESFAVAINSLRANKLRTALTLIGVVVGVASVIAVVTIIKGLDQTVASTFSSQGSTVFTVSRMPQIITSREDFVKFNRRKNIAQEDAEAIMRHCQSCWRIGTSFTNRGVVKHGDQKSEDVPIRGITLSMLDIEAVTIEAGRAWTESEGLAAHEVCVIGYDILANVFNDAPAASVVDKTINVGGQPFRIVGVAQPFGKVFGFSRDNFVFIPTQTAQKIYGTRDSITVHIQVEDSSKFENTKEEVRTIMRNRRSKSFNDEDDGFALESQDVFISLYSSATSNIYLVTIGVAAVSLVVGGIVVMNIMLVSVTERTKEIGIRKAVGARQIDILRQFLIESVTVTALGGAFGVLTGFGLAYVISFLLGFPLLLSFQSAVLGVGVSSVVGIISGMWPAWRAAQLDPIEALRKE